MTSTTLIIQNRIVLSALHFEPQGRLNTQQLTIQEFPVKHGHSCNPSNKLEVGEVVFVAQARVGIDLESVVISGETREGDTLTVLVSSQLFSYLHLALAVMSYCKSINVVYDWDYFPSPFYSYAGIQYRRNDCACTALAV